MKVTAKERDWEYLVELVLLRPRPPPPLIGPSALKSIGALLSVKEGNWFSVETGGGQNRERGRGSYSWSSVQRQVDGSDYNLEKCHFTLNHNKCALT